ncbi:MAG: Na+/H+ antiporter NhaA [Chloroflexota bacterium]|nr:Na+/H+ antiporter NhaA [Chloroflexota bacterium]
MMDSSDQTLIPRPGQDQAEEPPSAGDGFSLREFIHNEAFGGVLLLTCALVALAWANSPWRESYHDLWHAKVTLGTVHFHLTESLLHWVNDGLMAIFFFVVGLEIKREVLVGELASPRRAALPAIAALGGVLVPATIYLAVNAGQRGSEGWGIPMATDIAFALGVLTLLGDRVPLGLKVFLTALAIVDDIAAVLVIALFYTAEVHWEALGWAAAFLVALVAANRLHLRQAVVYGFLGLGLWAAVFESGIHATVAGVLLAFTIPARTRLNPDAFVARGRVLLDAFARAGEHGPSILTNGARQEALSELGDAVEGVGAPLQRLEHALHPWVAYVIVPLFALANAGVRIDGDVGAIMGNRVTLGVVVGLVVGKQVGITLFAWLAVRAGLTGLPDGVSWRQVYGAAWLAGIGFTMSLFVADLAFAGTDETELLTAAKLGILAASLIAGGTGWLLLGRQAPPTGERLPI